MKRTIAVIAAVGIAFGTVAAPAVAAPKPAKPAAADKELAFKSFLDQLVAKGTITSAQAEAIVIAMKEKRGERQAKMEAFSAKADALIAALLGMTIEKFREARANRTLPTLTANQKAQIRIKLDELALSMGLPRAPKGHKS